MFPERGVYRPGEPVHVTALVRDKVGAAAVLPVTLIVTRPDGVEHRRVALPDQGLGGRAWRLDLAGNATLLYYMSEEAQEGKQAFLEKRKPDWSRFPRLP